MTSTKEMDRIIKEFSDHGMECGSEIAKIAKDVHPDAIAIIPLYRSCIVITQTDEERRAGDCTLHGYGDPHWLGKDIDMETLTHSDFHVEYSITGHRAGPYIDKLQR